MQLLHSIAAPLVYSLAVLRNSVQVTFHHTLQHNITLYMSHRMIQDPKRLLWSPCYQCVQTAEQKSVSGYFLTLLPTTHDPMH